MKKKLKLDVLKVQSFITAADSSNLKGGATVGKVCGNVDIPTFDGCLTGIYPTLDPVACANTGTNRYNCPCDVVTRQADC